MNQFTSRTEAAKTILEAEDRSDNSLAKIPATFFDVGELVSSLIEGATKVSPILSSCLKALKIRASQRYESRFEYLLENVSDDIRELITQADNHEERLQSVETKLKTPRFEEILVEAAIQTARATTQSKIQRLAHVAVSGAVDHADDPLERVLEFERHAVELEDTDVLLLSLMEEYQAPFRNKGSYRDDQWLDDVRSSWQGMIRTRGYGPAASAQDGRSSLARLQARGMIVQVMWVSTINSPGTEPYALLDEGSRFLGYLSGYGSSKSESPK